MKKTLAFVLTFLLALSSLGVRSAQAVGNIIYVNDNASGANTGASWTDAYRKLQNALDAAAAGDQIWVAAGTYYPDEGTNHTNNNRAESFGLLNGVAIYGGFDTADTQLSDRNPLVNITILSGDIDRNDTNIDGNKIAENVSHIQGSNAFNVVESNFSVVDATAILDGFVITAGKADGDPNQMTTVGAGMKLTSGDSPTLANLTFIGNDALANGGGLLIDASGDPTLSNITFTANHANLGGGAYSENNAATFTAITFNGNTASGGGGLYLTVDNLNVLSNIVFTNNTATLNGGGLYISGASTPSLTDAVFSGNDAFRGGGLFVSATSHPGMSNVTISGNTADYGGGISLMGASGFFAYLTAENVTISGNEATENGGGVYGDLGNYTFTNVTISDNSAVGAGDGAYNINASASYFRNVLIANNVGGDCVNLSGSGTVSYYSLYEDATNACGIVHNVDGNIVGTDPLLGPLQNNGGTTETHKPLANSPIVNKGTNSACPTTDQRGITRPQGGTCDIGAVEIEITSLTLQSLDIKDGHVLESGENTNVGGSILSAGTTFHIGDDAAHKQYIAILHFDTSSIPDTAIITSATLKIKKYATVGTDPFTILGGLTVDMRTPSFGADLLSINDFQIVAGRVAVATFDTVPVSNWYSAMLNGSGRNYVSKTSTTQFRLRFATDDNNNAIADYMRFYSGDHGNPVVWPTFTVEYYVP